MRLPGRPGIEAATLKGYKFFELMQNINRLSIYYWTEVDLIMKMGTHEAMEMHEVL